MNNIKKPRILLLLLLALFTSGLGFSQGIIQGNPEPEIREAAVEKAVKWKDELSLTSKQTDLMQRKFIEFGMKRQKLLRSRMREEEKIKRLRRLQVLENKDMRDILTRLQYNRYINLLEKRERKIMRNRKENQ